MYLEKIHKTGDIRKIEKNHMDELAAEIRDFLIHSISETGGHLGSNLGVVELTMALHLVFNLPKDKIVFDVGHQCYTHKLLTGRKDGFANLRQYGGMSGFPKRCESDCDIIETGHSTTSISAALGLVKARDLKGTGESIVAVIGDGSLTGGMAYEALNNAGRLHTNFIIILNDNNMSISENVGGMSKYLNSIRNTENYLNVKNAIYTSMLRIRHGNTLANGIRKVKKNVKQLVVPGAYFEDLGLTYMGPIDGHDIPRMVRFLEEARKVDGAVLLHVNTQKGKGFTPAVNHPARFHGAEPFDITTGLPKRGTKKPGYTDIFSTVMIKLAQNHKNLVAITAAMPDGTGLKRFRNIYKDRFFDVGIAEEHAVTFAAGLAAGGMRPVVAIYSSFLQRSYDQIIHDVCMPKLPVIFAIDRAGLVGADGETHQGVFDVSFLSTMPGMEVLAPKNIWELSDMFKYALTCDGPVAIRYPRGEAYAGLKSFRTPIQKGVCEPIYEEEDICLFALGNMVKLAEEARKIIKEKGYSCSLVNARFAKPLDISYLQEAAKEHTLIVTLEENALKGGMGSSVCSYLETLHGKRARVLSLGIPDEFISHGSVDKLLYELALDPQGIAGRVIAEYLSVYDKE